MLPDEVKQFLLLVYNSPNVGDITELRAQAGHLLNKFVYRNNGAGPREFKDLPVVTITPFYQWDRGGKDGA